MAISKVLEYKHLDDLKLDPLNPRLGRDKRREGLDQDHLLNEMASWALEELVDSFTQGGGFWTQDALIVLRDTPSPEEGEKFVVIEGNRRVAALKLMQKTVNREIEPPRWLAERLEGSKLAPDDDLFTQLPVLVADSRDDVMAYLGFRHVTGIKQWRPVEKAEFISGLVDNYGMTYRDVAKLIGSRSDTVRQHYIAFKMLLQMEEMEDFDWSEVEERFSLLFLSIRSEGTRDFLGVELKGDRPAEARPIPAEKLLETQQFVGWLFGGKDARPVVRDSRNVDRFGEILGEPRAVDYLRKTPQPDFETAYALTSSADLVLDPLREAARNIRLALDEIGSRTEEGEVQDEAWTVIEGGVRLAQVTGAPNLDRAKEMLLAA